MLKKIILKPFVNQDYITQKKAEFIFRINLGFIFTIIIISIYTAYLDIINPKLGEPIIRQQLIYFFLLLCYFLCLYLLSKGYLKLSSHLLLIYTSLAIWGSIFFDKLGGIFQLDTIAYLIAILTMLPLVIDKYKKAIIYYIAVNVLLLIAFCFSIRNNPQISEAELLDYLLDTMVAFFLLGIVLYNILGINYNALSRAKNEIKERIKIEAELKNHKENLEKLVDKKTNDLQILNKELKTTNKELYKKYNIINQNNKEIQETFETLKDTQLKLVQNKKMIELGTLTLRDAYEGNNPLTQIIEGLHELEDYHKKQSKTSNETTKEILNTIRLGVEKTKNIIEGLNQLSQDSNSFNDDCNIHSIIDNSLLMLQGKLKNKIKITKNYLLKSPQIKGNASKLNQLMLNILYNTIDSSNDIGTINITTEKKEEYITVSISDNGYGIKNQDKKIELNMPIAHKLIKEHNGKIETLSEIDKGTTVILKLPV